MFGLGSGLRSGTGTMLAKRNTRARGMSNGVKSGGWRGGCSQSGKM
jgi:hypothetical protein